MRLQVARPSEHAAITELPFLGGLDTWDMPNVHNVLGLHRHVVKLIELDDISYVVKELPDDLALREFRLLREIAEAGLPTAEVVAVVTGRPGGEGMIVTRHLDYSVPYRSLLMGRGLEIPYLGDRLLDALVALLVRIHLDGFFWGDCSLSNTLFRRDAGALQAYIIDVETAEHHVELSPGQRRLDLMLATDNIAGGLLDLQAGGQLSSSIDPIPFALALSDRYEELWAEITAPSTAAIGDIIPMQQRLERLHELGFDVEEMEVVTNDDGTSVNFIPRVVEHGHSAERLKNLTGLTTGENQARRMLHDIRGYKAWLQGETGQRLRFNVAAVRWLDAVFEPMIEAIPDEMLDRLEAAEMFHQFLEHRWYMNERSGTELPMADVVADYLGLLADAPAERRQLNDPIDDKNLDPSGESKISNVDETDTLEA